jgi:hypothetical protein
LELREFAMSWGGTVFKPGCAAIEPPLLMQERWLFGDVTQWSRVGSKEER